MSNPVAYIDNANGSVTVRGFARRVRISAAVVRMGRAWDKSLPGGWTGPKPEACPGCGVDAYFHTRSVPRGEELVLVYYECANCGKCDTEPMD